MPAPAAIAAAAPAAWPVIQHCGISRMNAWVAGSQAMWRPPASTPSSSAGRIAPYGTEMFGNFCDGDGDTPISSAWRTPSFHSSVAIGCVPTSRRVWRTPICGADCMIHARSKPGACARKNSRWATIRRRDSSSTLVRSSTLMPL